MQLPHACTTSNQAIVNMSVEPECSRARYRNLVVVTIDSITECSFLILVTLCPKIVLSLRMTKRHVCEWSQDKHNSFISQLNKLIDGGVVRVDNTGP